jgi:simple sugar transport system ATP-binding protein
MDAGVAFGAAGRLEEGLIAGLSLTEHIALTAKDTGEMFVKWRAAKTITDDQLKRYDVRGKSADSVETLSGGNQQRMLMALMPGAPILMALEQPTRGLDVDSARWIWTQLLARRDNGTAIVFTSPDLDEIVNYSDRIFVVYAGHTVEIQNAKQTTIDELGRFIGGEFEKK